MTGVEAEPDQCGICGTALWWRVTELGTRLRLDADPSTDGNVIILTNTAGEIRARILSGVEMPAQQTAYRPHRCPPGNLSSMRCRICGRPMRPVSLFRLLGWDSHPGCDPEDWM